MPTSHTIDWAVALGHLHPLVLHLPIGLLVALAFLQLVARADGQPGARRAHGALVLLLVVSTPLAGVTGWLLHEEGGYPDPVELHEWFGIGLTFLSLAIGIAFLRRAKAYGWLVALGFLLLFPTGHFGAVLTHGEDFLLEPWFGDGEAERVEPPTPVEPGGDALTADATDLEAAPALPVAFVPQFDDVRPVLERYCDRCHGERKQRGGLALHTLELAQAGGDIGPAVVLGDPEASLLLARLDLPLEHEDHMPPASKSQPRPDEVALLRAWVAQVAYDPAVVPETPEADSADGPPTEEAQGALEVDAAAVAAGVAGLRARLVHVQAVADGRPELWVDTAAATLEPGELASLLEPVAPLVEELWLARQPLSAEDLAYVAALPALRRLDLRGLPGEPRDLRELGATEGLRVLNVAGTALAPAAADVIVGLAPLERVYVWNTGLDAEALRAARDGLEVLGSVAPPDEPVELEPEVAFERFQAEGTDEPASSEDPPAAGGPINATCPVSGSPVDPAHVVEFRGKTVGFCCPNCPRTFEADPTPFLAALGLEDTPTKD